MINQHKTIKENIAKYNKPNPLADFLKPFIVGKKKVCIIDVGSGPYSVIGSYSEDVDVDLILMDNQDFTSFWNKYNFKPYLPVEIGDMEKMDDPSNWFDVVVCINALDHTNDAQKAVEEMIRVCKPGGYVYIDCHLDQADTGHKHKWNVKSDGCIVDKKGMRFGLEDYGFEIKYIDNGGERRYNHIVAVLQK